MNRAATLALFLFALPLAAPAKDLIGVFEDALHNDPVIRGADANRLAARESKPQALAALLPQLNGTAGITREHASGFESQIFEVSNGGAPQLVVARTADQIDPALLPIVLRSASAHARYDSAKLRCLTIVKGRRS